MINFTDWLLKEADVPPAPAGGATPPPTGGMDANMPDGGALGAPLGGGSNSSLPPSGSGEMPPGTQAAPVEIPTIDVWSVLKKFIEKHKK